MDYLQHILGALNLRLDAKYTAALDQQLEAYKAQTYDIEYPEMKARSLIPLSTSTDPGAESISYSQWDEYAMAQLIANYADDLPMADVKVEKFTSPVHSIGQAYQFSVQDLRRAAMSGNSLEGRRGKAARRAIELKIDSIAAVGDAGAKLKGFLNHPNVSIYSALTDGTSARWCQGRGSGVAPKSPNRIQADMHTVVNNIRSTTKEIHSPDTMLLPSFEFGHVMQTPVASDNQTTILRSFLANSPYITNVDSWHKLDAADAAGTGPRLVAYQRTSEVLELEIPQDFEQFPPQAQNLAYVVPCHARVGGVIIYYPLAVAYMDGI